MARRLASLPTLLAAVSLPAQVVATTAPGFDATPVFVEASQGAAVRAAVPFGTGWLVALGATLEHRPNPGTRIPQLTAPARDDIAALTLDATRTHVVGAFLRQGTVFVHEPLAATTTTFAGVANTFDLIALPSGDVLLSANPAWPVPGAASGVWLAGPGRTPRELLRVTGPSGPIALDRAGNLIVGELGPVVPVPPGAARLLRFPAARLQTALAGGTLWVGDADRISAGWDGLFDLAFDDHDRLHVSDVGNSRLGSAAADTLIRDPAAIVDVGAGFAALHLDFESAASRRFAPFQPPEHAGVLRVAASDFVGRYEVLAITPKRPDLAIWPGTTFGAGTAQLTLAAGPPGGFCLFAGSAQPLVPEREVARVDALPIWFALDDRHPIATRLVALDQAGAATTSLTHPGGFAGTVHLQALALAAGAAAHGTSTPLTVTLLP